MVKALFLMLLALGVIGVVSAVCAPRQVPASTSVEARALAPVALRAVVERAAKAKSGEEGPPPSIVPGLSLTAPQKVTRPGWAIVSAKVEAKEGAKVEVIWHVEAQFKEEDVSFRWEVRDGGRSVQATVPDSLGIVRVLAVAIVDGKATSPTMAQTYIEVDYKPRGAIAPPAPSRPRAKAEDGPSPATPAPRFGRVTHAYFIVETATIDANIEALVTSMGLRNALRTIGVTPIVLERGSRAVTEKGLAGPLEDAGGPPAMVLTTATGAVTWRGRVPTTQEAILAAARGP